MFGKDLTVRRKGVVPIKFLSVMSIIYFIVDIINVL